MTWVRCSALLTLLLFTTVSGAAEPAPSPAPAPLVPVRVEKQVAYGTADGQKLLLDIAMPRTGGPYPAVVLMHGGAWRFGSRSDLSRPGRGVDGRLTASIIETVAAHGYVAVSVGYRLAPKCKFPGQIEDARSAVRFLRENARKYNLDPDRIAAGGYSAGAHLALLLGLADPAAADDGTDSSASSARVQAVVSFFGPTDLSLYAASPGLEDAYMVPVFGKECKTDPAVYERASPIAHVSKDDPPVLMIHGTVDLIVPIIHSERLLKKLHAAGVTAELLTVKGEGHGWGGPTARKTILETIRFLDQHLKGEK